MLSSRFESIEESLRDVLRHAGRQRDDDVINHSPRRYGRETPILRRTISNSDQINNNSPSRYGRETPALRRTSSNSVESNDEYSFNHDVVLRHRRHVSDNNYENVAGPLPASAADYGYLSPGPNAAQQPIVSR